MDDEWIEPDDQMGLWENQGQPLTVRWLLVALAQTSPSLLPDLDTILCDDDLSADLPVEVVHYDGSASTLLSVMHIDVRASAGTPAAVVITVT